MQQLSVFDKVILAWDLVFTCRNYHSEVFLRKGVLKICCKLTGEHPCRSVISVKLLWNFIEIALCHGCSPANLLIVFRTPFQQNTPEWLLLYKVIARIQNMFSTVFMINTHLIQFILCREAGSYAWKYSSHSKEWLHKSEIKIRSKISYSGIELFWNKIS